MLVQSLDNQLLRMLTDNERLEKCTKKIEECTKILKNYLPCVERKAISNIRWETQDKYISIAVYKAVTNNDSLLLNEILEEFSINWVFYDNEQLKLKQIIIKGLKDYVDKLFFSKHNNIQNKYMFIMNNLKYVDFDKNDFITSTLNDVMLKFTEKQRIKQDYFQGGFLNYLKKSIGNKLGDIIRKINSKKNKTNVKKTPLHKSYLNDDELQLIFNDYKKVRFPRFLVDKYYINNLSQRQIDIIKIKFLVVTLYSTKRIKNKSIADYFDCNIRTINREINKIKKHFIQYNVTLEELFIEFINK
jgi:phage pi2 protein 07